MSSYRKKPIVIEAELYEGGLPLEFLGDHESVRSAGDGSGACDWIIRGIRGELYPCKPDIFEATYEGSMTKEAQFEFPESFLWDDPATWPVEFSLIFEYAAKLALAGLVQLDKKMLDVQIISGAEETVTMFFAIGERADELRQAWRSVYAIHNANPAKEPSA